MLRHRYIILFVITVSFFSGIAVSSQAGQNALAILNFRPTNLEAMGYDGEILYALISALEKEKKIGLMARREMENKLFQAGMIQGDTPEMALEAGKVLGIDFVLFGQVTKRGGQIEANINLMDVRNNRVIKSWTPIFSGREDILGQASSLAGELDTAILNRDRLATPPVVKETTGPQVSIENLRAKSKGKKIILTWKFDPSQPITGFHIYRSENSEGPYQFFGKTDKNVFNDTKIKKGKSYFYRIGILHISGQEIKSKQTAEIKKTGEKTPYPPLMIGGNGYIRRAEIKFVPSLLNDQEKFKIKQYKIYRRTDDGNDWENISTIKAKITSQSELGFTVEDAGNLEDNQTYAYSVISVDKKNRESAMSHPVSITTINRPVLSVEKDDMLRKTSFLWEPMENVKGYYLYRRVAQKNQDDQEGWKKVGKVRVVSKSQFTDNKGLADGETYQYYLTAYDRLGETGPSNEIQAKTKDLPPPPQDLLAQSEMVKSVKLSWTSLDDPDVGGYSIYRGPDRKELKLIKKVRGYKSHFYLDKGTGYAPLEDGDYYYYAVTSYNLFGAEGEPTQAEIAKTKPRPATAKGVKVTARSDHILVQWDKNPEPDIQSYILYRNRNNGNWYRIKVLGSDVTSYMDTELKPETDYGYRVIVKDKDGLKSDPVESDSIPSPIVKPEG